MVTYTHERRPKKNHRVAVVNLDSSDLFTKVEDPETGRSKTVPAKGMVLVVGEDSTELMKAEDFDAEYWPIQRAASYTMAMTDPNVVHGYNPASGQQATDADANSGKPAHIVNPDLANPNPGNPLPPDYVVHDGGYEAQQADRTATEQASIPFGPSRRTVE